MNTDELIQLQFGRPHAWSLPELLEVNDGNNTLAHMEWGIRTITANGNPIRMLQIAWVCTDPNYEGRGLMSTLIRQAHEIGAKYYNLQFAGLFAGIPKFYERLGYHSAPNLGEYGMVAPLGNEQWNLEAQIDLQGGLW